MDPAAPPRIPDHELIRCIGRGAYGQVWLARNIMGTFRAVKLVYRRRFDEARPYEREFEGIRSFEPVSRTHDDLIDILQVGRNETAGYFYYVMELADDQETGQVIYPDKYAPRTLASEIKRRGRMPYAECLRLSLSLSAGLAHLHSNGLLHRDVKPSNIVFINGIPKIADIGLVAEPGLQQTIVGTVGYMPPEGPGTPQADIYGLGKVMYEMLSGKDRREYPDLPNDWSDGQNGRGLFELHQVVLKACAPVIGARYASVEALRSDLLLLQAGRSVQRLRALERRLQLLSRAGAVAGILLVLAGAGYFHVHRQRVLTTRSLAGSYVAYGTQLADRGDLFGALPSFASALQLVGDGDQAAEGHRIRLGLLLNECPKLEQVLFTTGQVNSVEFSLDGRRVLTAGGEAIVWETGTGRRVFTLPAPAPGMRFEGAGYSPDGEVILTVGSDHFVRFWSADSGAESQSAPPLAHEHGLFSARFDPTGRRVVVGCADGTVKIWAIGGDRPLLDLKAHSAAVRHAIIRSDGRRLITCGEDSMARIWRLNDVGGVEGEPLVLKHGSWVYQAAFTLEGQSVLTASYDGKARLWNVENGVLRLTLDPKAPVRSIRVSPDGRFAITTCWDFYFTTRTWDLMTGEEVALPFRHTSYPTAAAYGPDGRRLAIAAANGVVNVWNLAGHGWQCSRESVIRSADGARTATLHADSIEWLSEPDLNRSRIPLNPHMPLRFAQLSPDGRWLLTQVGSPLSRPQTNLVQIWDMARGALARPPIPFESAVAEASFSQSGTQMAATSSNVVHLWDLKGEGQGVQLSHPTQPVRAAFNRDDSRLVTWAGTNVFLWDPKTAHRIAVLPHESDVAHAEFDPAGRRLVTCCQLGDLQKRCAELWDAGTGRSLGQRLWHRDGVNYAAFSPDGRRVVTASEDRSARVWDAGSGAPLTDPLVHRHQVLSAVFSPDGRWVLTLCQDRTVRLWDARSGTPVTHRLEPGFDVHYVQFTHHGKQLFASATGGDRWAEQDGLCAWRTWNLAPDLRPVEDWVSLAQVLSGRQGDQIGGGLALDRDELRAAWTRLRELYPDEFRVSGQEILAWFRHEADVSLRSERWPAARFHLGQLVGALEGELSRHPEDSALASRRLLTQLELATLDQEHPETPIAPLARPE